MLQSVGIKKKNGEGKLGVNYIIFSLEWPQPALGLTTLEQILILYKQRQSLRPGLQHHGAISTSPSPLHQWPGHEGLPTGDVEQVCWGLAEARWSGIIGPDYF